MDVVSDELSWLKYTMSYHRGEIILTWNKLKELHREGVLL